MSNPTQWTNSHLIMATSTWNNTTILIIISVMKSFKDLPEKIVTKKKDSRQFQQWVMTKISMWIVVDH